MTVGIGENLTSLVFGEAKKPATKLTLGTVFIEDEIKLIVTSTCLILMKDDHVVAFEEGLKYEEAKRIVSDSKTNENNYQYGSAHI